MFVSACSSIKTGGLSSAAPASITCLRASSCLNPVAADTIQQPLAAPSLTLSAIPGDFISLQVLSPTLSAAGLSSLHVLLQAQLLGRHLLQAISGECGDSYDGTDRIRHAETPELAREALIDSVVLIFKSQVEVAFREQVSQACQHSQKQPASHMLTAQHWLDDACISRECSSRLPCMVPPCVGPYVQTTRLTGRNCSRLLPAVSRACLQTVCAQPCCGPDTCSNPACRLPGTMRCCCLCT